MLDFDRGLTRRRHPSGAMISAVKEDPGRWFDDTGAEVTPEIAAAAGFDVVKAMRARDKRQRLTELMREVEEAYDEQEHSYHLKHVGNGRYQVIDEEGRHLLDAPKSRLDAYERMQGLATAVDAAAEEPAGPARGRFRMVFAGPGLFRVKGPDGEALSKPLPKDEAKALIEELKHGQEEAAGAEALQVGGDAA